MYKDIILLYGRSNGRNEPCAVPGLLSSLYFTAVLMVEVAFVNLAQFQGYYSHCTTYSTRTRVQKAATMLYNLEVLHGYVPSVIAAHDARYCATDKFRRYGVTGPNFHIWLG